MYSHAPAARLAWAVFSETATRPSRDDPRSEGERPGVWADWKGTPGEGENQPGGAPPAAGSKRSTREHASAEERIDCDAPPSAGGFPR